MKLNIGKKDKKKAKEKVKLNIAIPKKDPGMVGAKAGKKLRKKLAKGKLLICSGTFENGSVCNGCPHAVPHAKIKGVCKVQICSKLQKTNKEVHCQKVNL